jgi:hypothetical protein
MRISRTGLIVAMLAPVAMSAGGQALAQASTLGEVKSIHVESNACPAKISSELSNRGFLLRGADEADAVLTVDVQSKGTKAVGGKPLPWYSAALRGHEERLLLGMASDSHATNVASLCDGIADDIANRLDAQAG